MNLKIIPNPDEVIYKKVTILVNANDGFCPCMIERSDNTKCICKEFREQKYEGECHCGRFIKIKK